MFEFESNSDDVPNGNMCYKVETFITHEKNVCDAQPTVNETDENKVTCGINSVCTEITFPNNGKTHFKEEKFIMLSDYKNIQDKELPDKHYTNDVPTVHLNNTAASSTMDNVIENAQVQPLPDKHLEDVYNISELFSNQLDLECQQAYTKNMQSITHNAESTNICYHGYKDGCTVVAPVPQKISEDVFNENWLKKLQILQQKEALLRNKELALQSHEQLLLEKQKELQVLERLTRNKLKYIDEQLKQHEDVQEKGTFKFNSDEYTNAELINNELIHSQELFDNINLIETSVHALPKEEVSEIKNDKQHRKFDRICNSDDKATMSESQKAACKSSKFCTDARIPDGNKVKSAHKPRIVDAKRHLPRFQSYASFRYKTRPKASYDDLDSTLSADIGDTSFIQTSGKFNPDLYKRPFTFKRTISERHVQYTNQHFPKKTQNPSMQGIEKHKYSEQSKGSFTSSQDKKLNLENNGIETRTSVTKFNMYSKNPTDFYNGKVHSYLNLEDRQKFRQHKVNKDSSSRPISWNDEAYEWLQKKREAYNMQTKKLQTKNFENKENVTCETKTDVEKLPRKKHIRNKVFSIFW